MNEQVDILQPPLFNPTGEVKSRKQAYKDGDWIGTFNLWVVTADPVPSIVYQQRSPKSTWAPNLLDVTAGGHLQAGERFTDGLREVEEELGKHYSSNQLISLGRKLYVGINNNGTSHNNIIDICMVQDDRQLSSYVLQEEEVYAIFVCPVNELLKVHRNESYSFKADGLTASGEKSNIEVSRSSFPENWDPYHYKIAVLVDRYFKGEKDLLF
jgi:isopentenyldiphosphate isomerase